LAPVKIMGGKMNLDRRIFSALLAGTVAAPRSAFAPAVNAKSAFRVGADGKLDCVRKYDIDVGAMTRWWSAMVPLA
jgi:hypothetical protein